MEKIINLLSRLIQIDSIYPNEYKLGEFIKSQFIGNKYHLTEQRVDGNRSNIIVEKGKGDKTILLYAHLDTVGIVDGWTTNPQTPTVIGDKLYALGAYDMKGGMAVNINTFLQFRPKNIKLKLLFCVDEENISKGGHIFAESSLMKDVDCVLSPEPAFMHGVNGIVIGRIGRAVIQVTLSYPSKHFYYYEPKNDIHILASNVISKLKRIFKRSGDKKEFIFVRQIKSQAVGMSTPQDLIMELDLSVLPPRSNNDMLSIVTKIIKESTKEFNMQIQYSVEFKKRETPFLSGYELKKADPYLIKMKDSVKTITGKKAAPYFRSSVADENIFGSYGKTVLGIGPEGANAHSANEWVSIQSLIYLQKIYLHFLRSIDR